MNMPFFDGKYEFIKTLSHNEAATVSLINRAGSSVDFIMLSINDPKISEPFIHFLKNNKEYHPVNILDWHKESDILHLVCVNKEDLDSELSHIQCDTFSEKAEAARNFLKILSTLENEEDSIKFIYTFDDCIRLKKDKTLLSIMPLNLPEHAATADSHNISENIILQLNKIFGSGIDKDSHMYYNSIPPEVSGFVKKYSNGEIDSLKNLYYAYTHSYFYSMFGFADEINDSIGRPMPTPIRAPREIRSTRSSKAIRTQTFANEIQTQKLDHKIQTQTPENEVPSDQKTKNIIGIKSEKSFLPTNAYTIDKQKSSLKKPKNSKAIQGIPVSNSAEESMKNIRHLGACNFADNLTKPAYNSRGMKALRRTRRIRIAVILVIFFASAPIIAHATGFDKTVISNLKKTEIGGVILNESPTASFIPDTGKIVEKVPVTFINQSVDNDPNDLITSAHWFIMFQGRILYESKEIHMMYSFPSAGRYTVSLTVADSRDKLSKTKSIEYKVVDALGNSSNDTDGMK